MLIANGKVIKHFRTKMTEVDGNFKIVDKINSKGT